MSSNLVIPDAMTAPSTWPPAEPLALPVKYELDPFQKHAVLGIHAGDHVFVTAKTGSGKTFVGEYLIARALAAGGRVFYTTPIKSLSNQKYHDLKRLFPAASVGILTGDIKMCPDADVVVMTAEILRNLFYKRGTATEGVGLSAAVSLERVVGIVMDEVHYIQDPDRGHVWEETLILCPRELQLVLLSATLPSAADLAGWLANLHGRRTQLLETTYRIVPLEHGVLGADGSVRVVLGSGGGGHSGWNGDAYSAWLKERAGRADAVAKHAVAVAAANRERKAVGASRPGVAWTREEHDRLKTTVGGDGSKAHTESPAAVLQRTVQWLRTHAALPALFFVFSRRRCQTLAHALETAGPLLDGPESAAAQHVFDFHLSRHRAELETSPQYHQLRGLVTSGIAFHHSGLQPLLKEIVEVLFSRGLIRVLFATETFAVGLNMPTKTVVFLELEKWCDGGERRPLRPDEYIQMAGRAGRRGLDTKGLVLYQPLVSEPLSATELRGMMCGRLPALESRMRFGYDFLLRLRLGAASASDSASAQIAEKSYWAQQQRVARAELGGDISRSKALIAELTDKFSEEQIAALKGRDDLLVAAGAAKNAAARRLRTALDTWETDNKALTSAYFQGTWKRLQEEQAVLRNKEKAAAEFDGAPLLSLDTEVALLTRWGLLDASGEAVTRAGMAATECNEANCILLPRLVAAGGLDGVAATELPIVLAAMLTEGGGDTAESEAPSLESHGLSDAGLAALRALNETALECQKDEAAASLTGGGSWDLSLLWVAVVAAFQAGRGIPEIAAELGLFEGNVLRGLMRVGNMLEELAAVAELQGRLDLLETVRSRVFLQGALALASDSIYLRL